ncbi:adenylate/guanylate cyclase domain-containing protein [Actinoplanes sp. N902-109]|uniref:adenylate/guanylate cyclase domain-containing protein n=1 Tax=Actinoplanes sp. (strain N902-109) TaxID=649831 RepID=UPI0003293FE6|nr:adenylate/guanylate cyclase domain-containing protein [Actinoplanes sp. N902-109]AGL19766.1 adenylyl cyclase class-3/4/guanylyl cyclase [Actinoplanes sp. N902-109]
MSAGPTEVMCRRQTVTILFVDIVGFTTLVDELDCADVHDLQREYFAAVSAVLRAAGGIVEKFIGDAVMAVFGTAGPDAGTPPEVANAAAAAARAGLLVQEALRGRLLAGRHPIKTRVGLATGDAMVDPAAQDGGYGMVSGSVVATASRLQAYAPHDTVVVCAATQQASAEAVAYQELPPVSVHGKRAPVELWRALHPRAATFRDDVVTQRALHPCR